MKRIAVYCGAKSGQSSVYKEQAMRLGSLLAESNIELVYGGGHVGLMGAVSDALLAKGGRAIGVIPTKLVEMEQAHRAIQDLRIVPGMHERKALMAELADAFIALPGGFGTLEELFEVLTWSQIGYHVKPIVLVNTNGFFDSLISFVEKAVHEGFIYSEHAQLLKVVKDVDMALHALRSPRNF